MMRATNVVHNGKEIDNCQEMSNIINNSDKSKGLGDENGIANDNFDDFSTVF